MTPYSFTTLTGMPFSLNAKNEIIEKLLELKCWNLPVDLISANATLFASEPVMELINKLKGVAFQNGK